MKKQLALVGIIPRKNLWGLIQREGWYHIPCKSAPKNAVFAEYLGFYFPYVFGEELRCKINFYAPIKRVDVVQRIQLFPEEIEHEKAQEDYLRFSLGEIKELPKPIPSARQRRIVHIPTSYEKLLAAKEINDLYDTSPLEEKMYLEMKKQKISPERQVYVKEGKESYYLDFGIFCQDGNIDVEADGERYHTLPQALKRDRMRNNQLTSFGWHILRFSGQEINHSLCSCLSIIKRTIKKLGGFWEGEIPEVCIESGLRWQ